MLPNDPTPSPSPPRQRGRKRREIPPETREEIIRLAPFYGCRPIADRVQENRKIVQRVLLEEGLRHPPSSGSSAAGKLEPFLDHVEARVAKRLTTTRILRAPALPIRCTAAPMAAGCVQKVSSIKALPNRCQRTPMRLIFTATVLPFTNPLRPPS